MKTQKLRNYLFSGVIGLAGIVGTGLTGCGWNDLNDLHGDCFKTANFYYENREECEANNGEWGRWGLFPEERCNMLTNDYGSVCNGFCDCEGDCIADSELRGHCSEHVSEFGCYSSFDEEGRVYEICKD